MQFAGGEGWYERIIIHVVPEALRLLCPQCGYSKRSWLLNSKIRKRCQTPFAGVHGSEEKLPGVFLSDCRNGSHEGADSREYRVYS